MKSLELIGFFNEFKDGALVEFYKRNLTMDEVNQYFKDYTKFKELERQKKPDPKELKEVRDRMIQIEKLVDYSQIVDVRKKALEGMRNSDQRQ